MMAHWQAEAKFPSGATYLFGFEEDTDEDTAWELAAEMIPASMPAPADLKVTLIPPGHQRRLITNLPL
jgi:hypothetical protein